MTGSTGKVLRAERHGDGERPAPGPQAWRVVRGARRPDLLPVVVALAALAVYLSHGLEGWITRDRAFYAYAGQQVLEGHPPYVAVANRSGPLAHLFPAVGIWLGRLVGVPDAVGARAGCLVLAVAAVVAVYLLCRDLLGARVLGLIGAATMLSFHGLAAYASDGPNPKVGMVLFFALFLRELLLRRWFTAGLCGGICAMFLQIAAPPAAGAAITALVLLGRERRVRSLARLVAGGLVPLLALVVYFIAVGALHTAVENYWTINRRYTTADPFWFHPGDRFRDLLDGYGIGVWVLLLGLLALLVLAAPALRGRRDRAHLLPLAVATVLFVAWSMTDFDGWADAFPALPLASAGIAALAAQIRGRLSWRAGTAVVAAGVLLLTADAAAYSLGTRDHGLIAQRAITRALDRNLPPDPTFFTMQAPEVLTLGQHHSISPYVMFSAGFEDYVDASWPGGLTGFGHWVGQQRPTVITVQPSYGPPDWLRPVLHDYQLVGQRPWLIYVRDSVSAQTRRQLRQQLAAACPARSACDR